MDNISYDFDLISGQFKWGPGLKAIFGYPATEQADTMEWWTGHIHPDDAMVINQAMDKLLDPAESGWTVIYRFLLADGRYVAVQDKATITRDHSGQALRLIGTLNLIAEKNIPLN